MLTQPAIYVKIFSDLTATSHLPYGYVISNFSCTALIPLLIPNTPYSNLPKASYVEQAMTGFLLGDGVLVKKYKRQRRVEELILNSLKVKFCLRP